MTEPRVVLASASPRRRDLLAALGLPFEVREANLDESTVLAQATGDPPQAARLLAQAKAEAVEGDDGEIVVGADTIVWFDGRLLGKPRGAEEAKAMLRELRGREHSVTTAVAVRHGERTDDVATSRVVMRWYGDTEIERYIARGEPFDKAGAYAIQDREFTPVVSLRGCYCAVVGLPLWRTARLIGACGLTPSDPPLPQCQTCPDRPLRST